MTQWKNRITGYVERPAHELRPNPQNARKHPDSQRQALRGSLDALGFAAPVLVNTVTGHVIDGHARLDEVLAFDPDALIPVIEVELQPNEEKIFLATFDYITYLADYGKEELETLFRDVNTDSPELQQLFADMADEFDLAFGQTEPPDDPGAQIDRAEELNEQWQVQPGDLYEIEGAAGVHRLLCGDSTSADDVARVMGGEKADLMVTDPPYGVSYADKNSFLNLIDKGSRVQTEIVNDHESVEDMSRLWLAAFTKARSASDDSASYYVTSPQGGELMMMMMMIQKAGWQLKHCIIWVKNNHVLGRSDYNYKHEPILFGWNKKHHFYGDGVFKTSVWPIDKPLQSKEHPTMKPVSLFAECLNNSSKADDIVYDPFGGSGTTMVACEQLQRQCRMIEIEPKYCAVILQRMQDMGCTIRKLTD